MKYASIVMDADTGLILSQRYADKVLHPASLTKMMTLLLLFEALERGDISLRSRIRVSSRAASMVPVKLGLKAGSSIRVEDAIYALAIRSANDIAAAVGEHLAGSESRFALLMTRRARDIGMSRTTFRNASGLHDPRQVSTARDMARLARYILVRYPQYYKYFSAKQFTYRGKTYRTHNNLMNTYSGMDGFKTGYINASGFNLVSSARRNGRRIIGVVFGGRTARSRDAHMAQIMDRGFARLGDVRVASAKNAPVPDRKPVPALSSPDKLSPQPQEESFTSLASLSSQTKITSSEKPEYQRPVKQTVQETPAAQQAQQDQYVQIRSSLQSGVFSQLIGEGDYDPSVSKRLETGLLAMAVHTGKYIPNPQAPSDVEKSLRNVGYAMISKMEEKQETEKTPSSGLPDNWQPVYIDDQWAIQIGAYTSRVQTDQALQRALKKLPEDFSRAAPVAVPLQTEDGILFRARFVNLSKSEAVQACRYFQDCMTVAPSSRQAAR
ncbi:MAG: D-alanyl-D-alanine carboxypeptidase [Rhodospirillales bacterium]|nr:D-alanyl-D-alanine carboxypeptidase [Alphaproteobacteria bacterium]USO04566.1 MAG: D-alanyl-D-alanine carboxypeptidase [Rhodospirillales bacterium]